MKELYETKRLTLNKKTISNLDILSRAAQNLFNGGYKKCWENLWTKYYCDKIWSGDSPKTQE